MNQPELFDRHREPVIPIVRPSDPETSHEAALTIKLNRNRLIVLGWLGSNGPATHEELAKGVECQMTDSGARGRCNELVKAGLVERAGYGTTHAGRRCLRWRVKQ